MAYASTGFKMVFDGGAVGSPPGNIKNVYHYATNDDAPTVEGAGYFNAESGKLTAGDAIVVSGDNDGAPFLKSYLVTANTGGVVTVKPEAAGLSAAATLDFPSIGAQSQQELTISVPGAAVGDAVLVGLPAALSANIAVFGYVSAADTVKLRAVNPTAGAIDPPSASYRATVLKA
jgi:hypothetical protein